MNAPDPTRALLAALPSGHALDGLQLRAVFAGTAVGMVVLDAQAQAIDTNPAAEALLGLPREEILGRSAVDPRWRAVLEGTRTATWQWNVQTGEVEIDLRFAEMLGPDAQAAAATSQPYTVADWQQRIHADDRPGRQLKLQQHFDCDAETFEAEYRMRHGDGSWRWMRDRGRVVSRTSGGEPLAMLGTHDDITTLKEAELARSHHDDLMRALFEQSPLGLQLLNVTERKVVAVNDALMRITGYSRDELMHGDSHAHYAESSQAQRDRYFAEAPDPDCLGPTEVAYIHRSGRVLNLLFNGVRATDARGQQFLWLSVADMTERHTMERALRAAAHEDSLTGLLNRSALHDRLQQQINQQRATPGGGLAVLFLDFDRFKIVNDTLGHNAGDELLRAIAQRLRTMAGQRAAAGGEGAWAVARFGGDEFVIVLPASDTGSACTEAQAVLHALAEPYTVRQQALHSTASIGIAVWQAGSASADDMLRDADTAMYEAKRAGRGRAVLFDDTMRARLTRAAVIETELRHAVERGQLEAVYQPIVDLDTGAMTAVEALMRWQHPELGAVSPNEFIPVAEESGHIMVLGAWILRTACLQWTAWQRENPALAPALMSVNLSREQVTLGRRVITLVSEALAAAGMPPGALQLEITEREVMKNPEQARALLQELSAMGVKLAMDDFGTGTSSLGCLRDYPFDTIKIDKSFVTNVGRDPHVLAVAHATVNVIENLGMVSVAEGIEDPAEVAVLQAMGCRFGQGYLFARPQAAGTLLAAMAGGGTGQNAAHGSGHIVDD